MIFRLFIKKTAEFFQCVFFNAGNVGAVSYTHLDVYKRQNKYRPQAKQNSRYQEKSAERYPEKNQDRQQKPVLKNSSRNSMNKNTGRNFQKQGRRGRRSSERLKIIPLGGLEPVSYTHLDVYKRQAHYYYSRLQHV